MGSKVYGIMPTLSVAPSTLEQWAHARARIAMRDQRGIVEVSREYKCGDLHSDVALEIGENI
jgi:DNA-binding transcriptional regulator YdaS (Cro superfamily)